jgi:hypothetical protein
MRLDKDFDKRCQQVWIEAWVRTAQSNSCMKHSVATEYADQCLAEFKKRFKDKSADHGKAPL